MDAWQICSDRWRITFIPNSVIETTDDLKDLLRSEFPNAEFTDVNSTCVLLQLTYFIPFYYLEDRLSLWKSCLLFDLEE